jgi:hypothetical protein
MCGASVGPFPPSPLPPVVLCTVAINPYCSAMCGLHPVVHAHVSRRWGVSPGYSTPDSLLPSSPLKNKDTSPAPPCQPLGGRSMVQLLHRRALSHSLCLL